ncbi:hypothetical protein GOBAR_AA07767 [Gossypium barbadense]|uniref:Uncharacterized protein n=1 Tax=Gossypium barbadense TaxID=3634 RepID=A0A2P5YBA4_GOSBA|nr:hypothetical protein GOBAR_AA07767 [Gossypium barbadense]
MGGHEVGVDSKNSGANYSYDGKCKTWDHETKVERDDFVALGDDYGGPKRGNNDAEIMSTQKFHDQASNQVEGHSKAKPSLKNLSSRLDNDEPTVMGNTIESKRLSEVEAKEVINLMNKDYKGFDQPRQKPPINNHVSKH